MHFTRTLVVILLLAVVALGSLAEENLPRPFTADEIREAWQPGLRLVMRHTAGEVVSFQRWVVVSADEKGAEIEYTKIDAQGRATAEATVSESTWIELRDHATFAAGSSSRTEASANTALGPLEGWLYTVNDQQGLAKVGTTTIFFFAKSLPGAPVDMLVTTDGEQTMRMEMIERKTYQATP